MSTTQRHPAERHPAERHPAERRTADPAEHVRLVYHYQDGHDFTTETMLRRDAVAYMPLLQAVPVDDEHYRASFADIELRSA